MTYQAAVIPGGWELILILLAVLLLFGGRKLPELASSMGSSITMFKRGLKEDPEENEKLPAPDSAAGSSGDKGSKKED
jgi:sec-independent protein translocase protein TatA